MLVQRSEKSRRDLSVLCTCLRHIETVHSCHEPSDGESRFSAKDEDDDEDEEYEDDDEDVDDVVM